MGAALRLGGYAGRLIGVEHGQLVAELPGMRGVKRLWQEGGRRVGARARFADVAVSDFMLNELRRHAHASRTVRIYNSVDPFAFSPSAPDLNRAEISVGCVARLIAGKGVDHAIVAVAALSRQHRVVLHVAGEGPERERLGELVRRLGLESVVHFHGLVRDLSAFWRERDVAVVPSDTFVESFCLVALEAMAAGKPVVGTQNGGLPEVIEDGRCGIVVPPGEPRALAVALGKYARDRSLMAAHGLRGRQRVEEHFAASNLAQDYLALFAEDRS
jgi:glycosyltransferase involved in cell wall biosynthesis